MSEIFSKPSSLWFLPSLITFPLFFSSLILLCEQEENQAVLGTTFLEIMKLQSAVAVVVSRFNAAGESTYKFTHRVLIVGRV